MKIKSLSLLVAFLIFGCEVNTSNSPDIDSSSNSNGYNSSSVETKVAFTPSFLPIKFTLDKNGLNSSYTYSILTFIGKFDLIVTKRIFKRQPRPFFHDTQPINTSSLYDRYKFDKISVRDRDNVNELIIGTSDIVVAIVKDEENVDVFVISQGLELELVTEGLNRTKIKENYVEIDVRHAEVKELFIFKDSTSLKVYEIPQDHYTRNPILRTDILNDESDIDDIPFIKLEESRELNFLDSIKIDSILKASILEDFLKNDSTKSKNIIPY